MKSLKHKLVFYYLILLFLSIGIAIAALMMLTINYYQNSARSSLKTHAQNLSNFYNTYLSNESISKNRNKLLSMYVNTPIEVLFFDKTGRVIKEDLFFYETVKMNTPDIKNAENNIILPYYFKDPESGKAMLICSAPLRYGQNIIGFVRTQASLESVNESVQNLFVIFILVGCILLILNIFLTQWIAYTIVKPISDLEETSHAIGRGNFSKKAVVLGQDEISSLAKTMNKMAEELLESEQLKTRFISSVSHELRSPLTSIKGWALTLLHQSKRSEEEVHEGLQIIAQESERLSEMVNELLDFSKLKAYKLKMNMEKTRLNDLLKSIYSQMLPRAENQSIKLILSLSKEEIFIEMDPKRIRQVMINLLDNSLKHIEGNGIIQMESQVVMEGQSRFAKISISDNGPGIHPEDLPHIKTIFYQGHSKKMGDGLGIGLAICEEIIRQHDGKIQLESEYKVGMTVNVLLKL